MENLIGKINKHNTMKIVGRGFPKYEIIGVSTEYPYFDFAEYDKEIQMYLEELGFEDLPIIRKSWLDLYEEAKEVPYVRGNKNWFVREDSEGIIEVGNYGLLRLPMKFISKEDAEYIVKECIENNNGGK